MVSDLERRENLTVAWALTNEVTLCPDDRLIWLNDGKFAL